MKWKGYLVDGFIIASLALLVGGIGLIAAYFAFMGNDIPWKQHPLPVPPRQATSILGLYPQSFGNDPTGDMIYVTTRDGTVYSNTLFDDKWVPRKPVDLWDSIWCVAPGPPQDARLWQLDAPPVEKKVLDSAGWAFGGERVSIDFRCYVLYRDGSLEVWTHRQSKFTFVECASLFGPCGALAGGVIGGLMLAGRNRKARERSTPADPA